MHPEAAVKPNGLESDQALIILFANLRFHFVSPLFLCAFAPLPLSFPLLPHLMIFLRLAGFFQQFREYVCPAFSVPGFRLNVQRTGGILFDGLLSILF